MRMWPGVSEVWARRAQNKLEQFGRPKADQRADRCSSRKYPENPSEGCPHGKAYAKGEDPGPWRRISQAVRIFIIHASDRMVGLTDLADSWICVKILIYGLCHGRPRAEQS